MYLLKGDTIRTTDGQAAEVIEVWGTARTFLRAVPDTGGKPLILMQHEVAEIIQRKLEGRRKG